MVNRTQALVLGFFLVAWVSVLTVLVAAPEVYDQALGLPGNRRTAEIAFLVGAVWLHWVAGRGIRAAVALGVPVDPGSVPLRCAPGAGRGVAAHRSAVLECTGLYVLFQGGWAWSSSALGWSCWPTTNSSGHGGAVGRLQESGPPLSLAAGRHGGHPGAGTPGATDTRSRRPRARGNPRPASKRAARCPREGLGAVSTSRTVLPPSVAITTR